MNKRTISTQTVELSPLDMYISSENVFLAHQTLMKKLNVTFVNKSKEPTLATLLKIQSSTRKRRNKPEN
jgi:hypothetical protein